MATEVEPSAAEPTATRCWCCDGKFTEESLVRLGAHPEVAVCTPCARYLARRAVTKEDAHRRGLGVHVRGAITHVRQWVIDRGWHNQGALGAVLRRVDRYLP